MPQSAIGVDVASQCSYKFVNLSCLIEKSTALVPKNVEGRSGYPKMHHIYAEFREALPEKCPKILGIAHLQGGGGCQRIYSMHEIL